MTGYSGCKEDSQRGVSAEKGDHGHSDQFQQAPMFAIKCFFFVKVLNLAITSEDFQWDILE